MTDTSTIPRARRTIRIVGACVAAFWLVAMIVTDGMQKGTIRNIITDAAAAQQTILHNQGVIVVETFGSFFLAILLVVFGAVLRRAFGDGIAGVVVFGSTVLAGVVTVLGGAVSFAELAAAHHHNTTALVTLGYLVAFAWSWEGAAWGFLLLATGWTILATRTAPRWFGIITVVLSIPVVLGIGAVAFWALAPVWFAAVGFLLTSRRDVLPEVAAPFEVATSIGA